MLYEKKNGWKMLTSEERETVFALSESYKKFMNENKTELSFVEGTKVEAEAKGFKDASKVEGVKAGDKLYYINRDKNIVLVVVGEKPMIEGLNFVVSHIDSPRIDLKQNPLYEDTDLALMKTHYYGGIKKYQWASLPLALHGDVFLASGKRVKVVIGEKDDDPVFTIPDLLPHLYGKSQGQRTAPEVIKGEEMHILVGSIPSAIEDKEVKELVKYHVLEKLNKEYGMVEEDFLSAEFQLVPAIKAKDVGLDRGLLGAYGHDDRVCGYTSFQSIIDLKETPEKTAICFLADKEETGSAGSTGLQSEYIDFFVSDLIGKQIGSGYNELMLRKAYWNSRSLSSDVNAGINPIFKSVNEEQNAAKLGYGIVLTKYTGSRGKSSTNDADAEYVNEIRRLFNDNGVIWQTGTLGKVDEGGGGTVAMFLAHKGIRTIDAGPALLAMHSPFEVASKLDIYQCYKAYIAFYTK